MTFIIKQVGKRSYFKQWTAIGPMFTPKPSEATRFATKRDAVMSPVWLFPLTLVEIKEWKR